MHFMCELALPTLLPVCTRARIYSLLEKKKK